MRGISSVNHVFVIHGVRTGDEKKQLCAYNPIHDGDKVTRVNSITVSGYLS